VGVTAMIRAVLWDFGGVLTTSPFEAFNRYEVRRGLPRDFIRTINATNAEHNAWARFESSVIGPDEFDTEFETESRARGHAIRGRDVMELLSGDVRPRMVAALRACKARYKVGCLTNNVKSGRGPGMAATNERASAVQAVMELFDVVVESSKEGIRKPNPAFYLKACALLDVEPREAVFLDDLGINLKPAKALGMTTIKVVSEAQALEDLAAVVDLS
jgi:putative hydrolase of the HAD superfamily